MFRVAIALAVIFAATVAVSGQTAKPQDWVSSYFEGGEFHSGASTSGPTVYRRDGFLPFVRSGDTRLVEDVLPKGDGAVVIFCYVQSSGGKSRGQAGSIPVAGVAVQVSDGDRKILLRADRDGYVVAALPAGQYEVSVRGFTRKASVEKGKSLLLPVRAGKRMVD